MGCDIHMHYEIKTSDGWKHYDWAKPYLKGYYDDGSPKYDLDSKWADPLCSNRNYNLFAILAGVRNGRGFAGCYTGEAFNYISEPRGLPDDATLETRTDSESWGIDGHSHTWLTLSEAMDFNYNQTRISSGVVNPKEFAKFLKDGKPDCWCVDVGGGNTVIIPPKLMKKYHNNGYPNDGNSYYTRVEWEESYKDCIGDWWFTAIETLANKFGKNNVRLVFWFDN